MGYRRHMAKPKERPWDVHPIWRGIGCIMLIIVPIMAYAGAVLLVEANFENNWVPIPWDLMGPQNIPVLGITVNNLYANLAVAALLTILGYGLLMFVYSIVYSMMGPARYGPQDAPPVRSGPKKRRR
jgi:hypothetical protein